MKEHQHIYRLLSRFFGFLLGVLRDFRRNQGFLLAGAIAYYTLLSIVPLSILGFIVLSHYIEAGAIAYYTLLSIVPLSILGFIVLSHYIDKGVLFQTLSTYIEMIIPGYATTLTKQAGTFIEHDKSVGSLVFLAMLFFSSIAFSVLESPMSWIFSHRFISPRPPFLLSAIIPYVYIFLIGLGVLLVSFIAGAIETHSGRQLVIFGRGLSLEGPSVFALYLIGILGEVLLLTSFYLVMPLVRITFRHALMGGMIATVLWEITRRVLVWYYSVVSSVDLIYGSLATTVVAL